MKSVIFGVNRESVESLIPISNNKKCTQRRPEGEKVSLTGYHKKAAVAEQPRNDFKCGATHRLKKFKLSGGWFIETREVESVPSSFPLATEHVKLPQPPLPDSTQRPQKTLLARLSSADHLDQQRPG